MSIMQDYEKTRKLLGDRKYGAIGKYLNILCPQEKCDKFFEKIREYNDLPIEQQLIRQEKIKKEDGIIFLSDILYNKNEWKKFDKWYNENYLHRKVKVQTLWKSDFDDVRANIDLYQKGKLIANVTIKFDDDDINLVKTIDSSLSLKGIATFLAYEHFDIYATLPKISKTSKLMQEIFKDVCESESSMCYITESDWQEYYEDRFDNNDFLKLKEEVKKYSLEDVIALDYAEYKIIGFSNLETLFNDDKYIKERNKSYER